MRLVSSRKPLVRLALGLLVAPALLGVSCRKVDSDGVVGLRGDPTTHVDLPPLGNSGQRDPTVVALFLVVDGPGPKLSSSYPKLTPLRYVAADSRLLHSAFRTLGVPETNLFHLCNHEATKERMLGKLRFLADRVAPRDTVFVFFLGHGVGSRAAGSALVACDELLPVPALLEELGRIPANRLVLAMDACHSGRPGVPAFSLEGGSGRRVGGLAYFSAANAEQEAYESPTLGHGLFSYHLAKVLRESDVHDRNQDGWLDFDEILEAVKAGVEAHADRAGRRQTPHGGLINWEGPTRLLPVRKEWALTVVEPAHAALVRVRFPPAALNSTDRLWLVVCPRQTPGRYYPQAGAIIHPSEGPLLERLVYLGESREHIGEEFRVLLVQTDPGLHRVFANANLKGGLMEPFLHTLPIRAEQTVRRR